MNIHVNRTAALALLAVALCGGVDARMKLGANVNEHGAALDIDLLNKSRTTYVRTFFPATPFIEGRRDLKTDENLLAVKKAGRNGRRIILCLKWNFEKAKWRVPAPGSEREQECFAWADDLIRELNGMVAALETVNEVVVDTLPEDMQPGVDGQIPMVRFLQRLASHLDGQNHKAIGGGKLALFSGGFTRLDRAGMKKNPAVVELLKWIEADPKIAGANFHIHMKRFDGFEEYLEYIRGKIPTKPYLITEFSMVWKYKDNLAAAIGESSKGRRFAKAHRLDAAMTVMDYINSCIKKPVSETEWNEFLASQDWYNERFLDDACRMMDKYGVEIATFAFQQGSSGGKILKPDSTPWIMNPVFANKVAQGNAPASQEFMKDYLNWQKRLK
jgi:hypothetical protein